jgi:copper chaperone NosL
MNPNRRRFGCALCGAAALLALAGCGRETATAAGGPVDHPPGTACELDGMLLADYPGPKGQILYADAKAPVYFCDTVELVSSLLRPEQVRAVKGAWVQDMGKADWAQPRGQWLDAKLAIYVIGSRKRGSMGPTLATFAAEADATRFIAENGGKPLRFGEITPEMVDLSGGALHDAKM